MERTISYVMTIKTLDDPRLVELKRNVIEANKYMRKCGIGTRAYVNIKAMGRLGPNNPNAYRYYRYTVKARKMPKGGWLYNDVLREHATRFDVYTYPFIEARVNLPNQIHYDNNGIVHREDGPAIVANGFPFHYWHGLRFKGDWLKPGFLTPTMALSQWNGEQRRVAVEILGWDKILSELKATVIDEDPDPAIGTLLEVFIPTALSFESKAILRGNTERFLRVQCGTGRFFAIPVPPTASTALSAQAWMWGVDDFKVPEVRT